MNKCKQGLLYTRTDFVPKKIAKTRPKTRFNTNKSEVAKIHCVIWEILYITNFQHNFI